ncbi:tape measure domain-containing protein [Clostridium thermobutyricum]|uniref:Tape measure domain-containing protein n=1 Tax=Clostridium thermobutyricum TaxID=29372 RepID=N9XS40_9CLOT|nr:tape measure protein [Clostridium thermobutyricum]ENY98753.1 tape measure domain-containing protein [Clostridium thermobutyricum]
MSDGQIVIDTKIDTSGAEKGSETLRSQVAKLAHEYKKSGMDASEAWKKAWQDMQKETTEATNNTESKLESLRSSLIRLGTAISIAFVVDKAKDLGKSILETGISFDALKEQSEMAWTSILGSQEKAIEMFNQITNFAATTPFSQMGVDAMAKQLYNAGFQGKALFDQLTKFGDLGSALAIPEDSLREMVRQYAQVQQAQVAYTEDLNILQDRGIPIYKALAQVMHTNVANVKKLASQGKVTADIYNKAIDSVAKKFNGAMDKQSTTFNGLMSTLKDNWEVLSGTLSRPIFDVLKKHLVEVGNKLEKFNQLAGKDGIIKALQEMFPQFYPLINVFNGLGNILTNIVLPVIKDFFTFIGKNAFIIGLLATTLGGLLLTFKGFMIIKSIISSLQILGAVFGIVEMATLSEAQAQTAANLAFLACPAFWIVGALLAVVVGFIYLWNTSEGFRNFWIGLWNGIKEACSNAVNWISKKFDELGKWFDNLGKWFNSIPGKISNWFTYISNSVSNFWTNILNSINNWGISVSNKFKGWGNDISNMFKSWGNNISNFFTKTIPETFKKLGLAIVNFIKSIPSLLNKLSIIGHDYAFKMFVSLGHFLGLALGSLIKWGIDVWNFFTKTIPQWITFVGEWFSKLPGRIEKWLINTYHKVVAWGKDMIHKAVETASNFINNFTLWISQLPGRIEKWLITTYNNVVAWGSNMINKAIETASNFINNFIAWISQLPGRIANYLSTTYNNVVAWGSNMINKAIETASNFINNFINWISQLPGRFGSWLSQCLNSVANWGYNLYVAGRNAAINLVNSIVDEVKSLPGKMMNLGSYIVHGLWQGILNAKKKLMDDIRGFCGGFISGFKEGLGIHSPARKMIPIGKYTIQGVSVGMDNEMPNLNDQVKDQMSKMVNKMKATVKAETSAQSFKASFGAMTMNKSFKLMMPDQKQTIHQNINNNIVMDSDVIAAHTTHKVIENITENQDSYLVATGGIL